MNEINNPHPTRSCLSSAFLLILCQLTNENNEIFESIEEIDGGMESIKRRQTTNKYLFTQKHFLDIKILIFEEELSVFIIINFFNPISTQTRIYY